MNHGPFETRQEATAAARHIYDLPPGTGAWSQASRQLLMDAIKEAGVTLGAHDQWIVNWLADWEPSTVAVIAGLIVRAGQGSKGSSEEGNGDG